MINSWSIRSDHWEGTGGRKWVFLLVIASLAGLSGCGMFDVRDPVEPVGGCDVVPGLDPAGGPANVLFNFAKAVEATGCGDQQYRDSLAEVFELSLDAIDVQELPEPRTFLCKDADVDAQRAVSRQLEGQMTAGDFLTFEFGDVTPDLTVNTAFYLDMPYELRLTRSGSDSLIVRGTAELSLVLSSNETWEFTRWVDKREDPATSFGRWHAENTVVECN